MAKRESKKTGGGPANTMRKALIAKHEVFAQLAELIALVKFINPLSSRQPLYKVNRNVEDGGKADWRAKLAESEIELLLARNSTERHKMLADQQQLLFAREQHKIKMQLFKEQLSFAKLTTLRTLTATKSITMSTQIRKMLLHMEISFD